MAKSKDKASSVPLRRGSNEADTSTNNEVGTPEPEVPINGSFVAHYTALGLSGTTWVPQSTVIEALFDKSGSVHGSIHRNPGGTSRSMINFRGNYAVRRNPDLGTVSGIANFDLLDRTGAVARRQELFIVKRNASEVFFMLARSFNAQVVYPFEARQEPYTVFSPIPTGASVEGVFYKTG